MFLAIALMVEPELLQIYYWLQHRNGYCDFGVSVFSSTPEIFLISLGKLKLL